MGLEGERRARRQALDGPEKGTFCRMQDTDLYRPFSGSTRPGRSGASRSISASSKSNCSSSAKPGGKLECPACGKALSVYDHAEEPKL